MAGLVAVIRRRPDDAAADAELDGLARCYGELRGEAEHGRLVADGLGSVALLAGEHEPRCATEHAEGGWCMWLGTVFAGLAGPASAAPGELDGQFALLRFDSRARRLELLSDPFGLQAVYVAERADATYVSTSVLALARHLRCRPSRLGVEVFIRSGPHFGELTSWEGISRLPPATRLTFAGDGSSTREVYWRPAVDEEVRGLGSEAAARRCVEVAVAALSERYGDRRQAWCDLTGGFDSRLGSLLLDRAGARFTADTVGPAESLDAVLGARVAATAGWGWVRGEPQLAAADGWREQVRHAVAWGDGQMEVVQLAGVLDGHRTRARAATTLFAGGGGEHWRDYAWQQEGPLGGRTRRVALRRWVDFRFLAPMDTTPLAEDPTPRVRENLMERCRSYAEPFSHEVNSVQLDMLYALKSMAHFGAYQTAARGLLATELPFYAKPVFSSVFSVAPEQRNFHRLMRRAIALLDPRIAGLPTTTGGPAEPLRVRNIHRFQPYLANRCQGAVRKVTQRFPGPTLGAVSDRSMPFELTLRRRLLDDLQKRTGLDPQRMRAGRLYDRDRLRALLSGPIATTSAWSTVGRIATLELALEAAGACL